MILEMIANKNNTQDLNKALLEIAARIIKNLKSEYINYINQELGYTNAIQPLLDLGNSEIYHNFTMLLNLEPDTAVDGGCP
jgi:hypothetical protein